MGKNIIISEKTFNSLIRGTLNEAFAKMGRGRTSAATKLADVLESNRILMQNGLSLFQDTALNELPEIVGECANNPKLLNVVLEDEDNEIFTDLTSPAMSSIEQNPKEMGLRAAEAFLQFAKGIHEDKEIIVEMKLIERESSMRQTLTKQ